MAKKKSDKPGEYLEVIAAIQSCPLISPADKKKAADLLERFSNGEFPDVHFHAGKTNLKQLFEWRESPAGGWEFWASIDWRLRAQATNRAAHEETPKPAARYTRRKRRGKPATDAGPGVIVETGISS